MPRKLLVVGAGIVGQSVALHAVRRGFQVTVADDRPRGHWSASWGNAGLLVPSHFVPLAAPGMVELGLRLLGDPEGPFGFAPDFSPAFLRFANQFRAHCTPINVRRNGPLLLQMMLRSLELHRDMAADLGLAHQLQERGLLMVSRSEELLRHELDALRPHVRARLVSGEEMAVLNPGLQLRADMGLFAECDAHTSPAASMAALPEYLESLGVEFRWSHPVALGTRFEFAEAEGFDADEIVLAAGSWTAKLAAQLGVSLALQPGRGYSFTIPRPPETPTTSLLLMDARVAVTPMADGLRFAGTMELGAWEENPSEGRMDGLRKSAIHAFPAFSEANFRGVSPWLGLRPCTPDGVPLVGRVKGCRNVTVATGHAMLGWTLGPATGEIVADLLTDTRDPHPNLRPERF